MFKPLKITFRLDGTGLYYDPMEPLMLDGVLAAACSRHHVHGEPPGRDEEPFDIPLPLAKWQTDETWGWKASALFPDGDQEESMVYWRKRFRQARVEVTEGSPNLTNGTYRDWNMPLPLLLCRTMVAFAVGDRRNVAHELKRNIRWLGKKRAHGRGRVLGVDVEVIDQDWSCVKDGTFTRWMPVHGGTRMVRPRPPYWSNVGRVACMEIGSSVEVAAS